jgi:hypothetical protein
VSERATEVPRRMRCRVKEESERRKGRVITRILFVTRSGQGSH